jgi:hypothetical protein
MTFAASKNIALQIIYYLLIFFFFLLTNATALGASVLFKVPVLGESSMCTCISVERADRQCV